MTNVHDAYKPLSNFMLLLEEMSDAPCLRCVRMEKYFKTSKIFPMKKKYEKNVPEEV